MKQRVAICSPYKTATTAVAHALVELGVGSRMMPHRGRLLRRMGKAIKQSNEAADIWPGSVAEYVAANCRELQERFAPFLKGVGRFDVFHDAPFGHNHIHPMVLMSLGLDLKFVWVDRSYPEWLVSIERWERTHPKIYPNWQRWDTDRDAVVRNRVRVRYITLGRFERVRAEFPDRCLRMPLDDFATYDTLAEFFSVPTRPGRPARLNASG